MDLSAYAHVYILTNFSRTVLYTGVTSNLRQRITDHKNGEGSMFTGKYKTTNLVWYRGFQEISEAIRQEKRIKRWNRTWKDLYGDIINYS